MLLTLLYCGRYLLQRRSFFSSNRFTSLKLFVAVILRRSRTSYISNSQNLDNTTTMGDNHPAANFTSLNQNIPGGGGGGATDNEVNDDRLQQMFDAAARVIQGLPKDGPYQPSNSTKLRFYSLYKQATEGKCTQSQPSMFYIIDRAKWDAWNRLGDMTKAEAMQEYVGELKKIVETMSFSGEVQDFLEAVNPFYEFVNLHGEEMSSVKESLDQWVSSSSDTDASSSNTSAQTTPLHISNSNNQSVPTHTPIQNGWAAGKGPSTGNIGPLSMNGYINGHGDQGHDTLSEDTESKVNGDLFNGQCFASSFHPPSAPIHRRSITGFTTTDFDESYRCVTENSKSQDVLKVDVDDSPNSTTLYTRLSAANLQLSAQSASTESDRYYSGDSEPDEAHSMEARSIEGSTNCYRTPPEEPLYSLPGTSATVRFKQGHHAQAANSEVNLILQNTVERLNRDVDHILARVRLLEAAYANHDQLNHSATTALERKRSIFGVSKPALALILTWPFVAFFIIKLVKLWIRRRRAGRR